MKNNKILVGMSGGVDSSVAAWLLKEQGFEVIGVTMALWGQSEAEDARAVAAKLGIRHETVDLRKEFCQEVVEPFAASYAAGHTPNPCYRCNQTMKFGAFLRLADAFGADSIATGHYARIAREENGRCAIHKGQDLSRDQSYFLSGLTQAQLSRACFPLSDLPKDQVRQIAEAQGFLNARKKDSQDICFVPDGDYAAFLERRCPMTPGPVYHLDGRLLGHHRGAARYTLGQRKGLGISAGEPIYVCKKEGDTVYVGPETALYHCQLEAQDFVWGAILPPEGPLRCRARVRYRHLEQPATAEVLPSGRLRVTFDAPQRAITTGQTVALYEGDTVLGGGVIAAVY